MLTKQQCFKGIFGLTVLSLLSLPSTGNARCLSGCSADDEPRVSNMTVNQSRSTQNTTQGNQDSLNRTGSHDANGTFQGSLGDQQIWIGHDHLSVGNVGKGATVDNSISSTIIMGNVKE